MACRVRDPIFAAPFWPSPPRPSSSSARSRQRWGLDVAARRRANLDLLGFRSLLKGRLSDDILQKEVWGADEAFQKASPSSASLCSRVLDVESQHPRPADVPVGHGALGRLLGLAFFQKKEQRSRKPGTPLRGEMWPMTVANVDLPAPGSLPVKVEKFCWRVRRAYENASTVMFLEKGAGMATAAKDDELSAHLPDGTPLPPPVSMKEGEKIRVYMDPVLREKSQLVAFAVRLWQAGMLRTVNRKRCQVPLFTVVKKVNPEGVVQLRLVFDLREINRIFRSPPWAALGGPAPLPSLDVCVEAADGWELHGASGDVPDYFYRLGIPEILSEAFVLDGIAPAELRTALIQSGWTGPLPTADGRFLAFAIAPMGWSWAVWIAQQVISSICLSDPRVGSIMPSPDAGSEGKVVPQPRAVLREVGRACRGWKGPRESSSEESDEDPESAAPAAAVASGSLEEPAVTPSVAVEGVDPVLTVKRLLIHGAPVPRMGKSRRRRAVVILYVDDFVVLCLEKKSLPYTCGAAVRLRNGLRAKLKQAGFGVHKEEEGSSLVITGVTLNGEELSLGPSEAKRWLVKEVVEFLVFDKPLVYPEWIEGIVGILAWFMLLGRGGFSILDETYRFVKDFRGAQAMVLPKEVKKELLLAARLSVFFRVSLKAPYYPALLMTGASPTGGGLVKSVATTGELRSEAKYGHRSGWTTVTLTDQMLQVDQRLQKKEELEALQQGGELVPVGFVRVLVIGGGPVQAKALEILVQELGASLNLLVELEVADASVFPGTNILDQGQRDRLLARSRQGAFDVVLHVVQGDSWEGIPARCRRGFSGPAPVRSGSRPWGLTGLSVQAHRRCRQGNVRVLTAILCSAATQQHGGMWLMIAQRRDLTSEVDPRQLPEFQELCMKGEVAWFCMCGYGPPEGGDRFIASSESAVHELESECEVKHPRPGSIRGGASGVSFETAELLREVVGVVSMHLESRKTPLRPVPTDMLSDDFTVEVGTRIRAPPISARWNDSSRFQEVFRCAWDRREPSNVVETMMVVGALKRLARDPMCWGMRVVIASDNLCCIGILSKGRSSRTRMLMLARQAAALQLSTGIRVVMRWVPSERNWADGPSRGQSIGYFDQKLGEVVTQSYS